MTWRDALAELNPDALFMDGFDDACVGWIENRWVKDGVPVAVYSRRKCIALLMMQGMDEGAAEDFFEFNVIGVYMGPHTPMFLEDQFIGEGAMRKYEVWRKEAAAITVCAEDLNVDSCEGAAFWNFTVRDREDEADVTVAAIPFALVDYIVSKEVAR